MRPFDRAYMVSRHIAPLLLVLSLVVSTRFTKKTNLEAATLIEHAKQLSDIRAEGAPAFRLQLSFKIGQKGGSVPRYDEAAERGLHADARYSADGRR
jgi:hypothetical protein